MIGFEFLRPWLAWLLVLAPLVLLLGWTALARSRRELALWVAARHRARFLPGLSPGRARLALGFGTAGLALLALAALGPVRGYTYRAVSRQGLDLVLCLDTSRSMLAQDLRPSRLERAKREIVGLLDRLRGDRVALVAFSGDARDVAPLTRDRQTLEGLLAYVSTEDNQEGGTDLAAAIEHALSLFDGRTGAHEAIVLLTDGEDLEGKAAAQAEEAVKRGIRVFVVGLGTEAGGKIPVVDENGRSSFLRDPEGNEVVTKLGRESLAALAARTGGEFLSAEQSPTPLEDLYRARITRIQGREIEGGERRVPYDRFQWPLALGIACLLAELALRGRAPRPAEERGSPRLAAALLPLFALGGDSQAPEPTSFPEGLARVVALHRRGEASAAEEAARMLLERAGSQVLSEAERARAHFALGVSAATRALASDVQEEDAQAARETAREALSAARALAGPGELRNDATYDLAALELFHAESVRATIPEISGQPAAAPPPPPGAAPGAPPPEPPDTLKEARELYRGARTWFVERLRLEWSDEDTRANLELVQRRLRELDEIEKKREEQKQQQQNQDDENQGNQDDQEKDDQKGDEKDEQQKDKGDSGDQEEKQNPEQKDPEQQDRKPEDEQEGESKPEEPPEPQEGQPEEEEQGAAPEQPPSERVLTREEVMQLLDKLAQLEKQQKALEAALRAKRRAAAKRDW